MNREKVFVNDHLGDAARKILADFDVIELTADAKSLGECVAAIVWPFRLGGDTLRKMKSLKVVQTLSAGVDTLNFAAIPKGVAIFSNAGAYTEAVAEHAWGLALGAAKGLGVRNARVTPRLLRNGTLLVLGCGAIGSEVARLARVSLYMRTVGISRSFKSPEFFDERHQLAELPDVIGGGDVVVNTLPLTLETRSLLGYEVLRRAKQTVVITNVGRGMTVDEQAMLRLLRERPETRYATDVYWTREGREVFETTLWELPNFCGTQHVAGLAGGEEYLARVQAAAAENLARFLKDGRASNRVDLSEYVV